MNTIIILILFATTLFSKRIYQIFKFFSGKNTKVEIEINLPLEFYLKQLFGLLVVIIFLIAIDPVPAGIAIAAAFGIYINLFISIIWHSIREQSNEKIAKTA